jgi:hypothetical protein
MSLNISGNSFGTIGSLHHINFIGFWGGAEFNLVDYLSTVVEYTYVNFVACNSEMCFSFMPLSSVV